MDSLFSSLDFHGVRYPFLNLLYNIVDRMFIARIPGSGTLALTGVGICFPIITMIQAVTLLYGSGGSPLCAMARGRGDEEEAGFLMGNTFAMLLLTSVVLMAVGYLFHRPILYAFGASDVTFPYASLYIRIYLVGTVFVMITLGMNPFINSQGFARVGMLTALIGAVCNTILDPIFIFIFHMGVAGAAIATILSQMISAVWVLRGIRFITISCFFYTLAARGVLLLFPEMFIRLFNSDPELLAAGVPALHTFFFGFVFMTLQFAGQSTYIALGKGGRATFFSLFRKVIIVVPLTILLPRLWNLGVHGVFWAEPISNVVGGCACFFTMLLTVVPELRGGRK